YLHNDPASLAARLDKAEGNTLVVTDGVFSMDGNLADLPALAAVAQARGAWLMVDDAHGFGPLGASGGGIVEHFGLGQEQVPVLIGTLGKGFGTAGAFVAGSEELIETLIQYARPYIYTTSQPPAVACATLKSLELLRRESWRRQHLAALIARFRHGAEALGLTLMDSFTPIQPILVGGSRQAVALAGMLRARGIMVGAIRPPTVPANSARLRVTLSAAHSEAQVDRLLEALGESWRQLSSSLLAEIEAEEGDDA
ncbi:aminotransferase class I/II-fold pyridoxal phosphate-dependent enzyme, partial [Pseudomonas aeruginosa]